MTEQYKCPSYVDNDGRLQDCKCGKCSATTVLEDILSNLYYFGLEDQLENCQEHKNDHVAYIAQKDSQLTKAEAQSQIEALFNDCLGEKITQCSDKCQYGQKCRLVIAHNKLIDQATANLNKRLGGK